MYADFNISSTGDLLLKKKNIIRQQIKFKICNTKAQKISFLINSKNNDNDYSQKISFYVKDNINKTDSLTVTNNDFNIQLLKLKLQTVLGELPERTDFGSILSTYKHKNIDDKLISNLEKYLTSFLINDYPLVSVSIIPHVSYSNGYNQYLEILIKNNNEIIYKYILNR